MSESSPSNQIDVSGLQSELAAKPYNLDLELHNTEEIINYYYNKLDSAKLFGIGTVVDPTISSRLRHLRKVAELDEAVYIDKIISDFTRMKLQKTTEGDTYEQTIPAVAIAEAIIDENDAPEYNRIHFTTTALVKLAAENEESKSLVPSVMREMHAILVYSANPEKFNEFYKHHVSQANLT